ncbi:CoA transferase [Thermomicrobiaceae bacterium CFH 74404]|uniref:CoA transferase n=1 Tax=Thermalbibacter longus TaxID=2951981 RepID=A0AA41WAA1_9BACT|nr:CaiB/BaiF CoA-transferase family protein [Thermalbibacter longus]MCM8748512.1 CoA transferase [Thermalbibacter longus]
MSTQALSGIRVVDLTRVMAGPYCTMLLGDLGADVVKIERPGAGDDTRSWGPPFIDGISAYYLCVNRNKRSITLDLKHPAGQEILWRLIEQADVLVENFSPGTVERLGFGYEAVRGRRPQIVYCSISGFGQTGPGKDRTAYDQIVQGMSGLMSVTGFPDGVPTRFGVPIADIAAGMFAAYAIVAALFHRQRTGEGQYIDTSMLGGQVALLTYQAGIYFATGETPKRTGNAHPIVAPYQTFSTADGYVNIAAGNDAIFARLCRALGLERLLEDPRFQTNAGRITNLPALVESLEAVLKTYRTSEVVAMLDAADVPCGPIYTVPEVFADPQVQHLELRQRVPHPALGEVDQLGFPYRFSASPAAIRRHPPLLGEHTEEVLAEVGYSPAEIARLREAGAV